MKNFKNIFICTLITIIATSLLVSCGSPKTSPEESAKIFLDVMLKNDKTDMSKIGMTEEDYTNCKKAEEDSIMDEFGTEDVDSTILTDEIKTTLKDNIFTGASKLEYEVTPISTDKDIAKVNVKINHFSLDKITKSAQDKIKEEFVANPSMTQTQISQESFKLIGEEIAAGPAKEDSTTVSVNLTKKNNMWIPDDNFENDVSKVIFPMS